MSGVVVDEKIKLADVGDQSSIGMELMGLCSNTVFLLKFRSFFEHFRFACPNNWR